MKVSVVDAVAIDLRWIGKLFEIMGAMILKARSEVCVEEKLLSGVYSKSVTDDLRIPEHARKDECSLTNTPAVLSV